ncbi:MAG: hypothetical protein HQM08_19045 [Candidatus Riflebacteria bacterium]|nr:hypothetical protein [Candidatus Riflebacteria bacterium]
MSDLKKMVPGAVERLGSSLFATMDAFPLSPTGARVLYVRKDLLEIAIGQPMRDEEEARVFIEQNLLLTLDPQKAIPGSKAVMVYVDRQADPMNMSLNGNLGSGRAAYLGERFNLKGLGKTVLATSVDPNHSNGNLDLVSALWEMICSNVLQTNLRTGTAPILAVVDLQTMIHVPWREPEVPSGLIVRLDLNGELDRPTHLFQRGKPVRAEQLHTIASRLGLQDAEKFIERILHGCWSVGNTSLAGHLIDYDTVFAVRGRPPQWSYRPNWLSNFFGIEGLGQKKMLKAMVNDPINVDRVSFRKLFQIFDQARQQQLELRFLDLIGLDSERTVIVPPETVRSLVAKFQYLSMKMFPNFRATAPWELDNSSLSIYDLSRFFRFFQILRKSGDIGDKSALGLIRNPIGRFEPSEDREIPESIRKTLLRDYVVTSVEQLQELDKEALAFVRDYERLLTEIERKCPDARDAMMQRAYVVNEERTYMNCRPGKDIIVGLVQNCNAGNISVQRFSELLHILVKSCDRIPRYNAQGRCQADFRLFLDGFDSTIIDIDGFWRPSLTILDISANSRLEMDERAKWEVEIDGKRHSCIFEKEANRVQLTGPKFPLLQRINGTEDLRFFRNGERFHLKQISRLDGLFEKNP